MNIFKKISNFVEAVWWHLVPYVEVNVQWPREGWVVLDEDGAGGQTATLSADPNDHYRPFMEEWIGRQNWDWAWYLANNDAAENRLTIRMRKKHAVFATHIAMMWS